MVWTTGGISVMAQERVAEMPRAEMPRDHGGEMAKFLMMMMCDVEIEKERKRHQKLFNNP